jgi:hypothetical protein
MVRGVVWLWLLVALTSCRQVLGLEHAELATPTPLASEPAPGPIPYSPGVACEHPISDGCRACRQRECDGLDEQCLSDVACRSELSQYAKCLGSQCDADAETCAFKADQSRRCLDACGEACHDSAVFEPCELYCACLEQCPASDQALAQARSGDCFMDCKLLPPEVRECRHNHCERAAVQRDEGEHTEHCKHASGELDVCQSYVERPISKRVVCTAGAESGWSCSSDQDCCSSCASGVCR